VFILRPEAWATSLCVKHIKDARLIVTDVLCSLRASVCLCFNVDKKKLAWDENATGVEQGGRLVVRLVAAAMRPSARSTLATDQAMRDILQKHAVRLNRTHIG